MALLEHVEGRPLTGDTAEEQRLMATTLARAHAAGAPRQESGAFFTDWLDPEAPGVAALPWLPPAIARVRRETDRLATTWTLLHTDPAPEAFLHDGAADGGPGAGGRGMTGLIDWTGACRGPVLYDVASAIMYLGGLPGADPFLTAYREASGLEATEFERLDAFRRFRWVVQAVYFAGRLASGDLTGIDDRAGNEKGLADARRGLAGLGVRMQ